MNLRDRVAAVLTAAAIVVGAVGGFSVSFATGCFVLCGLLLLVALVLGFTGDEGSDE